MNPESPASLAALAGRAARRYRTGLCTLLLVLAGAASPTRLPAQTTVTLEGRVLGDTGAPVSAAQVSAVDLATRERRDALSGLDGEFRILGLHPARYTVTANAMGYQRQSQLTEVVIGQRPRLTFELVAAAIDLEPVEVQAPRTPAVEIRRTSVSTPVLAQEIRNLPLSTRNAMDLAGLAPGIRSFRPSSGHALPSAGGLRGERFLNLYLDGLEMKSLYDGNLVGFPHLGSALPADALREFRVFLNPYDAEYAHAAAYLVSAVTHRGTNHTEGSAFGFLQPRGLVASNDFLRAVPNFTEADFQRQQLGASLRGPIVRNRLFYAASYELSDTRNFVTVVPGRPAFDPGFWDEHAGVFPAPNRNHTGLLRLTYAPREAHDLDAIVSTRYLEGESLFGGSVSREGAVLEKHAVHTLNLRHRWRPTPRLINELGGQFVGWSHAGRARVPGPALVYPSLQIGRPDATFEIEERHFRLVNRVTYAMDGWRGSHLTRAGVEIARVELDHLSPVLGSGRFEFAADTATLPRQARIGIGAIDPDSDRDALSGLSAWVLAAYLHHEWRPLPSLTVNLGLRYDAALGLLRGDFAAPWLADPELVANPELQRFLNPGRRRDDLDNLSPRVSLSWDVFADGRTFLRGGFGIIYDRVPGFIPLQEQREARWRTYQFENPGTTDPAVLRGRVLAGDALPASLTLVARDLEAPENRQWSVGLGRRVTTALALNLDYIHHDVRNLFARLNLNWLDRSGEAPRRALSSRHGDIFAWDDFARARYRALLTQLTYQPNTGVRFNLAYTLGYAEADWDVANLGVPAAVAAEFYVMQRISGDERHRFVLSGLLPLPLGLKSSWIATVASPRPYLAIVGQDLNQNDFFFDDRLDGNRFRVPSNRWSNWYRVVDVRLTRAIPFPRGRQSWIVAEAFNVFNAQNYSGFHGRQRTPLGGEIANFQQPSGVFGTRQMQLGARIDF